MPNYDYYCPANDRTVEVLHGMTESLRTWGDVCARAEIDPGKTDPKSPVERRMGTGMVMPSGRSSESVALPMGGCGSGCACHPG